MVKSKDREFTRLVGGFNEGEPVISDLEVAKFLNHKNGARHVRELVARNLKYFEEGLHIIDLNKGVDQSDTLKDTLISSGYSKQAIAQAKNIYILSKAGFLLYLKFAEGDKAVSIYKDFLEDYFQTKAENEHMKLGIQEQIEKWKEKKALAFGMSVMAKTEDERIKYLTAVEEANTEILELEKINSKEEVVKGLQSKLHVSNLIENSKSDYDIGTFAKILKVDGIGRNKLYDFLRDEKILMESKIPYQQYMKYFTVIPVTKNNFTNNKALIKSNGVEFVVNRLIKSGRMVTRSVSDILKELDSTI